MKVDRKVLIVNIKTAGVGEKTVTATVPKTTVGGTAFFTLSDVSAGSVTITIPAFLNYKAFS